MTDEEKVFNGLIKHIMESDPNPFDWNIDEDEVVSILWVHRELRRLRRIERTARKDREWYKEAHTTCDDHPKPSNCTRCALDGALSREA